MTFLEGLTLVGVGATIFAVIRWIFSILNDHVARKESAKVITEKTRELPKLK